MSILDDIVARTRADVNERKQARPLEDLQAELCPSERDFAAALGREGLQLVAEFKPASPSRGVLRSRDAVEEFARLYDGRAAAMSVLCDRPHFDGGHDLLARARSSCQLPLLCKDFIVDEYQIAEARAAGADAILLMASILGDEDLVALRDRGAAWNMESLVEVHSREELDRVLAIETDVVGVNARDLHDLSIDHGRLGALIESVPPGLIVVAESGVSQRAQVDALPSRADAVLVGSAFMEAADPATTLGDLGW